MKRPSLEAANQVHACSVEWRANRHLVWHPDFRRFSLKVNQLIRELGPSKEDDYWLDTLSYLKRVRYDLSGGPLPFAWLLKSPELPASAVLQKKVAHCNDLYPSVAGLVGDALSLLQKVEREDANPLLATIEQLVSRGPQQGLGILVNAAHLIPPSQAALRSASLGGAEVISAPELRVDRTFNRIVVIGPASWYPEHVFRSPRSKEIHLVHWGWLHDGWKPKSTFVGSVEGGTEVRYRTHIAEASERGTQEARSTEVIGTSDMLPQVNWNRVLKNVSSTSSEAGYQERVRAVPVLLEGGKVVLLDSDPASTTVVIDLEEEPQDRVRRLPVKSVEPGMFLLLRTVGGGDYIPAIADRILGKEAERARRMQKEWKKRLVSKLVSKGLEECAGDLRVHGSSIASAVNILRWISYSSIRTRDYEDFAAIMDYVGLGAEAAGYWTAMEAIAKAHIAAGQYIRNLLLKEVQQSELSQLRKLGFQEFQLAEAGCGSMTAYRVTGVSPDSVEVSATRLHHVFEV